LQQSKNRIGERKEKERLTPRKKISVPRDGRDPRKINLKQLYFLPRQTASGKPETGTQVGIGGGGFGGHCLTCAVGAADTDTDCEGR